MMLHANFSSKPKSRACPKARLKSFLTFVRFVYVAVATGIVCRGFYHAYEKFISEDVSTRQEYNTADKLRYPSITFCYKYKHGSKRVLDNYLPKFTEKAQNEGMCKILLSDKYLLFI